MNKVLLFNPRSARFKPRIPNSILSISSAIDGLYDYAIVDGNMELDPWPKIHRYLSTGDFKFFGCTSMPGPQLKQSIPISRKIRELFPDIIIIWGGYFPSNQPQTVLDSGYVDFIISGPGERAFPSLLDALILNKPWSTIPNLIYKSGKELVRSPKEELQDPDKLPVLQYEKLNEFYPLRKYLGKTYLGK